MSRVFQAARLLSAMLGVLGICSLPAGGAPAQWAAAASDAENQAIAYSTTEPVDAVAAVQRAIDAGTMALRFDATSGYLRSALHALQVSVESQALVFSKTSFQREFISPARPRALYFNRDVYVGWVPGGLVLEVASVDSTLGPVFYTLDQRETARPRFQRQTHTCLQCHDSPSLTGGVPGFIMKSVYPDKEGEPIYSAGTFLTSDRSALHERWGGWYVTATHGARAHMGNMTADSTGDDVHPNLSAGGNVSDLRPRIDTRPYLSPHSDIVALMVLAHQNSLYNLITHAGYRTRMALHFDRVRNKELGRAADDAPAGTITLIAKVTEPLVRAMLFAEEAPLTEPVSGTSGFSKEFASQGPRDSAGRSLQALDLTRRLFRYPCSFVIYSASFDALPSVVKDYVYRRLWEVLSGDDTSVAFVHLSRADRTAIRDILVETKPDFAAWRTVRASR